MGLGDKLGSITSKFRRKSLDQKIDEVLGSSSMKPSSRDEFASTLSQLNKNATEKFRTEVSGVGRALFTRAEERFDSNYPAIEKAPFGDMSQEGPLTRDFDNFPPRNQLQSGFERMEGMREASTIENNPFLQAATTPPSLPEGSGAQPPFQQETSRSLSTADVSPYPKAESRLTENVSETLPALPSSPSASTTQSDMSAILKELQAIREQNAVILEKLRRIEEMLR